MKTVLALLVLGLFFVKGFAGFQFAEEWELWKKTHSKTYKDDIEEFHRNRIWLKNKAYVDNHNANAHKFKFTVKMNKYADLEGTEFAAIYNGYRQDLHIPHKNATNMHKLSGLKQPSSKDWRDSNAVTQVKNQGQCGSCWSFSATGSLEGQHAINTGNLIALSEQQLMDCSTSFGNHGCKGGIMDYAFKYLETTKDETEDNYSYLAENGFCRYDESLGMVGDTGFNDIEYEDENALLDAVANVGPISVAMDASHQSFQLYDEGIYSEPECSSTKLDHGVLVVGYGADEMNEEYWIVKNSWGEEWGMEGYFKLARNEDNMCGVATQASYPTGVN